MTRLDDWHPEQGACHEVLFAAISGVSVEDESCQRPGHSNRPAQLQGIAGTLLGDAGHGPP